MPSSAGDTPVVQRIRGEIAVYSCYFGKYEPLNLNAMGEGLGYDRVLFTDDDSLEHPGAQIIRLHDPDMTPALLSRAAKIRPDVYFEDHRWVIYVDNRASLNTDPKDIVAGIEAEHGGDAPQGRYLFPHHDRQCSYRELRILTRMNTITPEEHAEAKAVFEAAGFPARAGLYANTMMIQKMGDPATADFNAFWWDQFLALGKRDQVSLPFALWLKNMAPRVLDQVTRDFIDWPVYTYRDRRRFQRQHRTG
jgi:hypothetical protein